MPFLANSRVELTDLLLAHALLAGLLLPDLLHQVLSYQILLTNLTEILSKHHIITRPAYRCDPHTKRTPQSILAQIIIQSPQISTKLTLQCAEQTEET